MQKAKIQISRLLQTGWSGSTLFVIPFLKLFDKNYDMRKNMIDSINILSRTTVNVWYCVHFAPLKSFFKSCIPSDLVGQYFYYGLLCIPILCMRELRMIWWDCDDTQAHKSILCSHMIWAHFIWSDSNFFIQTLYSEISYLTDNR